MRDRPARLFLLYQFYAGNAIKESPAAVFTEGGGRMGGGAERFSSSVVCARMECIGHQSRFVRLNQTYTDLPEADKTAPLSAPIHTALQITAAGAHFPAL